jgi:DNA-binding NarL/FixJ family response regulator
VPLGGASQHLALRPSRAFPLDDGLISKPSRHLYRRKKGAINDGEVTPQDLENFNMLDTSKAAHEEEPPALTVLIADEHYIAREGLRLCLQSIQCNMSVMEAETLETAVSLCRSSPRFDLVLLDLGMSDAGGAVLDVFRRACPQQRVAVLSADQRPRSRRDVMDKGVLGYLPKNMGKDAFMNGLRSVLAGEAYAPAESAPTAGAHAKRLEAPHAVRNAKFTERQLDVLARLIEGKPNKQICRELNLALGTVKTHVGAIFGALEVSSRAEAIVTAEKFGLRRWLERQQLESASHIR